MDPNQPPPPQNPVPPTQPPVAPNPTPQAQPQAQQPIAPATLNNGNPISNFLFKLKFYLKVGRFGFVKIIVLIIAVLVFLTGTTATLAVYTDINIPFVSKYKQDLTLFYYKIPLIPKTPEQILIAAVDKNTRLKTYNPNFSFAAQLKNTEVELGSLDFEMAGPVDITDEKNFAFNVEGKAALNFGGKSYQIDGKLMKKDKAFYGKIDKLPDELLKMYGGAAGINSASITQTPQEEIQANLEELFKNWIKYEFKNLPTKAREELEKNIESTSITNKVREEAQEFLLKSSILPEVKKLSDEKIEGVDSYRLLLKPSKEKTKQIIIEYISQNDDVKKTLKTEEQKKQFNEMIESFAGSFEQFHMELWIGKGDAIVRKSSFQTQINLGFVSQLMGYNTNPVSGNYPPAPAPDYLGLGDLGKTTLTFSTVMIVKDVNKPVTISPPKESVSFEEYMQLFQDSFVTKDAKQQRELLKLINADLQSINNALTQYYVANNRFPTGLSTLQGAYIPLTNPTAAKLNLYNYRVSPSGEKFLVFTSNPNSKSFESSYSTQYYGITSTYSYPHQLSLQEFSNINQ